MTLINILLKREQKLRKNRILLWLRHSGKPAKQNGTACIKRKVMRMETNCEDS